MRHHPRVEEELNDLCADGFLMSAISYLEIMVGVQKSEGSLEEIENFLEEVEVVPFDQAIAKNAAHLHMKSAKKLKFKDLAIAATAQAQAVELVTADRDFKSIKGIQLRHVKIN
jgi:predicted nucleic acid-binding protein